MSVTANNHSNSSCRLSRFASITFVTIIAIGLTACGTAEHNDLVQYVNSVKAKKGSRIPPLPEFKTQELYTYNVNEFRDPYSMIGKSAQLEQAQTSTSELQPDINRNKEALEEFPLDALTFSGHLEISGQAWAVITAPDGFLHRVKLGNHIGTNHGQITEITETVIRITEVVSDGLGGWIEREAAISVKE